MSTVANLPSSAQILTKGSNALQGGLNNGELQETVNWRCPWGDSHAFFEAVVGYPQAINLGGGITISRKVPLQNPYNPNLFATSMEYQCIDSVLKHPGDPYYEVFFKITFSNSLGGTTTASDGNGGSAGQQVPLFCSISSKASTRTVTDTARQYTYSKGGNSQVKLKHDVGVQFGGNAYEITLYQIQDIDAWQAVVAPLVGQVNSQPFNLGAFQRSPGTVLFEGYGYQEDTDVQGNRTWTGTISLHCSSLPWNMYLVGGQQVSLSPQPYLTTDLNALYA